MMLTITGRKQIINYTGKMFTNTSRKYLKKFTGILELSNLQLKIWGVSEKNSPRRISNDSLYEGLKRDQMKSESKNFIPIIYLVEERYVKQETE